MKKVKQYLNKIKQKYPPPVGMCRKSIRYEKADKIRVGLNYFPSLEILKFKTVA